MGAIRGKTAVVSASGFYPGGSLAGEWIDLCKGGSVSQSASLSMYVCIHSLFTVIT